MHCVCIVCSVCVCIVCIVHCVCMYCVCCVFRSTYHFKYRMGGHHTPFQPASPRPCFTPTPFHLQPHRAPRHPHPHRAQSRHPCRSTCKRSLRSSGYTPWVRWAPPHHLKYHPTTPPPHHLTTSPPHRLTTSPPHHLTTSPPHRLTTSPPHHPTRCV